MGKNKYFKHEKKWNENTVFTIKIITSQDEKIAEEEIRNAIAEKGYTIEDFIVDKF